MRIGGADVVPAAKGTFKGFKEDDLQGQAAGVAYHFLFSTVPLLIFLTALSGFVSRAIGVDSATDNVTDWVGDNLPASSRSAVLDPITDVINEEAGGFLSFGAVLALWGARNAVAALMKALNVAFDVEETRPWWKQQAIALGLVVALGLTLVGASLFFLAGSVAGDEIAGWVGAGEVWTAVWGVLRWPLIALLAVAALAAFYWAAPNTDTPFRWVTPGAVLTVVLWAVATAILGIYYGRFAGYTQSTYGALGGVLAFVFWIYVMNLILLLGGELNATVAQLDTAEGRAPAGAGVPTEVPSEDRGEARPAAQPAIGPAVPWPSAERRARLALAEEGQPGQERRSRSAVAALGVSVAATVWAALVGVGRSARGGGGTA